MTTTIPASIPTRLRQASLAALLGAAITLGAMTLTAPAANAEKQTQAQIKAGCKAANGTYHGNASFSYCTYKDSEGTTYTDDYIDGEYIDTQEGIQGTPSSKPAPPPLPPIQNPGLAPK